MTARPYAARSTIRSIQIVIRAHVEGIGVVEGTSNVERAEIVDVEDAYVLAMLDATISMNGPPSQDDLNLVLGRLLLTHLKRKAVQDDTPEDIIEMCLRRLVRHGRPEDQCRLVTPAAICLTTNIQNATAVDQAGDHEVLSDG